MRAGRSGYEANQNPIVKTDFEMIVHKQYVTVQSVFISLGDFLFNFPVTFNYIDLSYLYMHGLSYSRYSELSIPLVILTFILLVLVTFHNLSSISITHCNFNNKYTAFSAVRYIYIYLYIYISDLHCTCAIIMST